ncbi:MAG: twin-arginine translocation signal domain-containing protein [Gammaproteobacteria bacterium]|nr:twin-arginine translocation signal domain-containing protein [Gammaproteobacteria bacterium]
MSSKPKFINAKRRGFLQGSAVATGAAATGAVSAETIVPEMNLDEAKPAKHAGYRKTDKVRTYYAKARY